MLLGKELSANLLGPYEESPDQGYNCKGFQLHKSGFGA